MRKAKPNEKNLGFGPKNIEKLGFSEFSHFTPEKRFLLLLYSSDWAQTHTIAVHLVVEGVPMIKSTLRKNWNGSFGFSYFAPEIRLVILL